LIAGCAAKIPHKIAMEFMLLGQDLTAQRAYEVGMVTRSSLWENSWPRLRSTLTFLPLVRPWSLRPSSHWSQTPFPVDPPKQRQSSETNCSPFETARMVPKAEPHLRANGHLNFTAVKQNRWEF